MGPLGTGIGHVGSFLVDLEDRALGLNRGTSESGGQPNLSGLNLAAQSGGLKFGRSGGGIGNFALCSKGCAGLGQNGS